jgi:hypothetical protein
MQKRTATRLLAVFVVFVFALLSIHAVSHWHTLGYDEDHCQVCHVGHVAIPRAPADVSLQAPIVVAYFAIGEASKPQLDFTGTPSIPRAPPA